MSEFGIKIKNIKAGTLYEYNLGVRDRLDYTDAMFNNSLFSNYIINKGLSVYKGESTRDIVCLEFDFGSKSYEEKVQQIETLIEKADGKSLERLNEILNTVHENKDKFIKKSMEEIRDEYYQNGVSIDYVTRDKNGEIKKTQTIHYKMLFRTPSKAKVGQSIFINEKYYKTAYEWLTMGLGNKMDKKKAKIVEMSAYAPLTTSTIVGNIHIPVENILILKDQDSYFQTMANIVRAEEYFVEKKVIDTEKTEINRQKALSQGKKPKRVFKKIRVPTKKCVVHKENVNLKNTLWDGMGLVETSIMPKYVNGMMLLRNHFFKMCGFRTNLQQFLKDWCLENNVDYETFEIEDMFGVKHLAKNIKVITTDNAIKWKKFTELMGDNPYKYWCDRIKADNSIFGIVKTDHKSKLGNVQQMSYQMVNSLPCSKDEIKELAQYSVAYVEKLKQDNDEFEKFLRLNANEINHYEMMADLYSQNKDFANSKWFRTEKRKIIFAYVEKLRKGKITVNADNLTMCGNPYALLLYTVGEDWTKDPCFEQEQGTIQCYTTRFNDGEYLCGIRSPQNSPNNICYLKNTYSKEMQRYFPFSENIVAVNCIGTDLQDRTNGSDFDSDFIFATNNPIMVKCAKRCYDEFPTIVNQLKESSITYENTKLAYSQMDNKFAKSRLGIGWSSNLAQLAMSYYWTEQDEDLYDNFVILSVVA